MKFEISFTGHENIRSLHQKTIEITKDSHLTPKGDCIVGINASYACADLPLDLKEKLRDSTSKIKFSIVVNEHAFTFEGNGHPDLKLSHTEDIVIRKSDFICPRTMAIKSDNASDSLPRDMVKQLQNPDTKGNLIIEIM